MVPRVIIRPLVLPFILEVNVKDSILLFSITYIILFILYFFIFYLYGIKKVKILESIQVKFLKIRFGFKNKDLNPKSIGLIICFIDPLIMSLTAAIITLPKWNYFIELLIGFILLLGLIYSFYEILGRILKKRWRRNEL